MTAVQARYLARKVTDEYVSKETLKIIKTAAKKGQASVLLTENLSYEEVRGLKLLGYKVSESTNNSAYWTVSWYE